MEEKKEFDEFLEHILKLLEEKKYISARDELLEYNAADIGEVIEEILDEISLDTAIIVFRMLPKDVSVDVFSYLPAEDQVEIINGITDREINYIIDELDFDDKIDVLEELPANVVDKILEKTPKRERKQINTFLNYPDNSAGTLMTPDYISLQEYMTVGEAMDYIKKEGMDSETIYTCYVKEKGRKLKGILSLRTLVISDRETPVTDLIHEDFVSINVYEDQEDVYEKFKKYGYLAIPVVDNEDRLVGIITMDDIFDVIEEETTEDMERMAGVVDDSKTSYLELSVWKHVKNRLPWLLGLMLVYIFTGAIIRGFESTLQEVICLTIYMPMLMGTGGNSGSQSATLIIRSMAVGDIDFKDGLRVLWKEVRVSFILGIFLSAVNFVRVIIEQHTDPRCVYIALTVCISTLLIVMVAKCIGSMLPMIAKRIGIDPALMASPMISSLTDMVSVTTFFLLATWILNI
ncbi:MAG: magnesium transporter [Eubacteriaceae bacterium]|nr:magnesium transporter [Eubacteriaceae bacterium]